METREATAVTDDIFPGYEEALALEWTLSTEELCFVLKEIKGDQQLLYFTAQLKSLENTGDFIDHNKKLPDHVINYLTQQLGITSTTVVPVSRKTQAVYFQKIKNYLGYHYYADAVSPLLKNYIVEEMEKELLSTTILQSKTCEWLKANKIMRPAPTILERMIASYRKEAFSSLHTKIANKLTTEQKSKMLLMLKRQPSFFSELNYYKKSPPEPTASKIDTLLKRFNVLKDLGITDIDFSDISEAVFNKMELLGRTYDAYALSRIKGTDKKVALLLCVLMSAAQRILDDILDMNENLLLKKERLSRNKFNQALKKINSKAKKGLKLLIKTTKQWLEHNDPENTTLSDFQESLDTKKIQEAVAACEQLSDYQSLGYYKILEGKYSDLRKYMMSFFELDFKGAVGTESIFKAITLL